MILGREFLKRIDKQAITTFSGCLVKIIAPSFWPLFFLFLPDNGISGDFIVSYN